MRSLTFMLCFAVAAAALGQDKKDDKKPENLDGKYLIVGVEVAGEKLPDELITKGPDDERTIVIKGDQLIAKKGGKEDPASFKLDASKTPAHIDMTSKKGDGTVEKMYGIYKFEKGTLTICAAESEKPEDRPKEFKTDKKSRAMILVLQRQEK